MDDDFSAHLDVLKRTLEYADVLEAKRLRMFSFFIKDDQNIADCKDQVFENLAKFCEVSKDSRILLCHENEKGIYGDNADRCLEILKQFPSIRQVFDPANFVQCSQDTVEAWKKLRSILCAYMLSRFSHILLFVILWIVRPQAFLSWDIPRIRLRCTDLLWR